MLQNQGLITKPQWAPYGTVVTWTSMNQPSFHWGLETITLFLKVLGTYSLPKQFICNYSKPNDILTAVLSTLCQAHENQKVDYFILLLA